MTTYQQIEQHLKVAHDELKRRIEEQTTNLAHNPECDSFVYVISHDLKAPLRAIANLSTWLSEDLQGQLNPENQHYLDLMRDRVAYLEAMIDALLLYSRIGRRQVEEKTTDLNLLLNEIVDLFRSLSTFNISVEPNLPTVVTKGPLLKQVFFHLISNAIKHHNRDDGQIQITAISQGAYYEFSVTDDGPGIAPESHSKIFDIFTTLKESQSKKNIGMGLAIAKKIVETESGQIVVESELGKGATFRFTWPIKLLSD